MSTLIILASDYDSIQSKDIKHNFIYNILYIIL